MRQLQRLKFKVNFFYHPFGHFFNKSRVALSLLSISLFLLHCASKYDIKPVRPKHSILSITPLCGRTGDTITIQGVNFSGIANENRVAINGTRATVFLASPTFLKAIVPAKTASGTVSVDINDVSSAGPAFNYVPTGVVSVVYDDISFMGLAADASKNLLVADDGSNVIRKITPAGRVSHVAGGGPGASGAGFLDGNAATALFRNPTDVAVDSKGNIYVSDTDNNCIRKITPDGDVTLYAGAYSPQYGFPMAGFQDGQRLQARFSAPKGIAIDKDDNLFVCDAGNIRIRKITPDNGNAIGQVTTIAGNGQYGGKNGPGLQSTFSVLVDLVVDLSGNIFITELQEDPKVRKISNGVVSNVAIGPDILYNGCTAGDATFVEFPRGIAVDPNGDLYVTVYVRNNSYKIITISPNNEINTLAGGMPEGANREGVGNQVYFPEGVSLVLVDNTLYAGTDYQLVKVEFK